MTPKAICSAGANKVGENTPEYHSIEPQHFPLETEGQHETTASNTIKPELLSILQTVCTPFPK